MGVFKDTMMEDTTSKSSVFSSKGAIPRILSMSKYYVFLTLFCTAMVLSIFLSCHVTYPKMQSHRLLYYTSTPKTCNCSSQASTVGAQSHKREYSRQNSTYQLFTYINHAYLPLALSWLCNTLHMDIHHNVLFFVSHTKTQRALQATFPNISVVTVNTSSTQSDQDYNTVGYVQLMIERTRFIQKLLQQGLDVLLFEVDCLWLKNPVQDLLRYKHNYDFVFTGVTDRKQIAGGFMFIFCTKKARKVWDKLTDYMNQLEKRMVTAKLAHKLLNEGNDQTYLSKIFFANKTHIRHKILSPVDYPDGQWYSMRPHKRLRYRNSYILNNNWIVGNAKKIYRAKQWHHWFLRDNMTCNQHNVKLIQTSPQTFMEVSPT